MVSTTCTVGMCNIAYAATVGGSVYVCIFSLHLSPMGPINELPRCPSRVWSQWIYPSLPGSRPQVLSRCRYSTALLHLVNQWLNVSSSRFPLRKPEEKFTPAESRTHKFRLSGRTLYPLDHNGHGSPGEPDEIQLLAKPSNE